MRKLSKLYKIALENYSKVEYYHRSGLCHLMNELKYDGKITKEEWKKLKISLYENKPSKSQHQEFYHHKTFSDSLY